MGGVRTETDNEPDYGQLGAAGHPQALVRLHRCPDPVDNRSSASESESWATAEPCLSSMAATSSRSIRSAARSDTTSAAPRTSIAGEGASRQVRFKFARVDALSTWTVLGTLKSLTYRLLPFFSRGVPAAQTRRWGLAPLARSDRRRYRVLPR